MSFLLVRTLLVLVVAVVLVTWIGWSWPSGIAVAMVGAAAAMQAGGVLWLRKSERDAPSSSVSGPRRG